MTTVTVSAVTHDDIDALVTSVAPVRRCAGACRGEMPGIGRANFNPVRHRCAAIEAALITATVAVLLGRALAS
jgi:hypothetical protein